MNGCPYCDERGLRWTVEEDPETGIMHTVGYPCDHKAPKRGIDFELVVAVAILALSIGLAMWGGMPR